MTEPREATYTEVSNFVGLLLARAKHYREDVADCTCADGDMDCWYRLDEDQQFRRSLEWAVGDLRSRPNGDSWMIMYTPPPPPPPTPAEPGDFNGPWLPPYACPTCHRIDLHVLGEPCPSVAPSAETAARRSGSPSPSAP